MRHPGQARDPRATRLLRPTIRVHHDVVQRALDEIAHNPSIEVGGKFVGHVQDTLDPAHPDWRCQADDLQITITGYLDVGPRADRSAVHHHSDTEYQFALFQRLLAPFPDLRFLGIWHSHHPNGLGELSRGDEQTGRQTVESPGHDLSFLLSFLAVDGTGLLGGRHYAFLRGHRRHYALDPASVEVIGGLNPVTENIDRFAGELHAHFSSPITVEPPAPPDPRPSAPESAWPDTPFGRQVLRTDQTWLQAYPAMRPYLRDGSIVWRGRIEAGDQLVDCQYTYPDRFPDLPPVATLSTADGRLRLHAELPAETDRGRDFARILEHFTRLATEYVVLAGGSPEGTP